MSGCHQNESNPKHYTPPGLLEHLEVEVDAHRMKELIANLLVNATHRLVEGLVCGRFLQRSAHVCWKE